MKKRLSLLIPIIFIFSILVSYGSQNLTREDAAKIINSNPEFSKYKNNILLQDGAIKLGISLDWWKSSGGAIVELSPKIRTEVKEVKRSLFGLGRAYMTLNQPIVTLVTVTGITGSDKDTTRRVEFDWVYDNLPSLSRRVALEGGSGIAAFLLYDDGYRMTELISVTASENPMKLSAEEKADLEREIAAGQDRKLQQAIAKQDSNVQITGRGKVIKMFPDDNDGVRYQRFLVKISSGDVILVAHNIDLAPRVDALREGDMIRFNGEYEWNNKGGVVHRTHKDPRSKHIHGWLEHRGEKYW